MCGLSVDHRIFTRIDVDESFKCRTEYRILKYEHVKKYTLMELQRTDCIIQHLVTQGNQCERSNFLASVGACNQRLT